MASKTSRRRSQHTALRWVLAFGAAALAVAGWFVYRTGAMKSANELTAADRGVLLAQDHPDAEAFQPPADGGTSQRTNEKKKP
jgi:hypothetical protein